MNRTLYSFRLTEWTSGSPSGSEGGASASNVGDQVQSLGWEVPLEKGMGTHSSLLLWRIPRIEEPGGSMWSQRVGHNWVTNTFSLGFPDSSVGKESACNAGDPDSIPGWGRPAGEGIGYPYRCSWASLGAQLVKNLACNGGDLGSIPTIYFQRKTEFLLFWYYNFLLQKIKFIFKFIEIGTHIHTHYIIYACVINWKICDTFKF